MNEPLGEPVSEAAAVYLPDQLVGDLASAVAAYEDLLEQLEPLAELRFGDTEEPYRQGAKETLLAAALALGHHRQLLASAVDRIVAWLDGVTLDGELVSLDDLGSWRVGDSARVVYDNERTASSFGAAVADEAFAFDPETGEIPPPAVVAERIVRATAEALGGLAPGKAWNVGPLRTRGLRRDQFEVSRERTARKLKEER